MSFKSLVSVVSEQCQEIKQALKLFPYFDTWDENVIAECCRLSSVLEFSPDNIICDSKTGNSHVVYFVLNGVCKMIHHLRARVKTDSYGRTTYKLYSSMGSRSSKAESNTVGFTSRLLTENYDFGKKVTTEGDEIEKSETVEERVQSPVASSPIKDEVTGECENEKKDEEEDNEQEEEGEAVPDTGIKTDYNDYNDDTVPKEEEEGKSEVEGIESPKEVREDGESERNSEDEKEVKEKMEEASVEPSQSQPSNEPEEEQAEDKDAKTKREIVYEPDHHIRVLEECRNKARQTIRVTEDGQESDIPEDVKSFFVQVGLFYKGACFGLETNVKDRIIMSATKVKCLRVPRQFLLQHNPSNIWNRIRLFLDLYLPKEDKILEYFIQDRKWAEHKRQEAERIVFSNRIFNYTLTAHVPYSIRVCEDILASDTTNSNSINNRRRAKRETMKNRGK